MAYDLINASTVGFCTEIVQSMAQVSSQNTPELLFKRVGALEWILSPLNRPEQPVTIIADAMDNNVATARIVYRQRGTKDEVMTDRSAVTCAGTERLLKKCTFDIEQWAGTPERKITTERFRQLCAGGSPMEGFMMQEVFADLNAIREHINEALLTELSTTCVGVNVNNLVSDTPSANAKTVTLLDADGNPIVYGINQIAEDMDLNQVSGPFGLIGQGNLSMFSRQAQWGCCNDGGLDLGLASQWIQNNMAFYMDASANSILGDNNFLVLAPGVAQMPTFNEYRGVNVIEYNDLYAKMRVPDPILPGLEYDFRVKYDICDESWTFNASVHYDFWCWCADVFQSTDELSGMTGVFLYNAAQSS